MKELIKKLAEPLDISMVEARIGQTSEKGFSLLLYKTARADIKRLSESGAIWKNSHSYDSMGLLTCTISIYDTDHNMWIDRTDVGTESQTEKHKGLYSDSFKRAGFRWTIGLELYNAPFIWVTWDMEQKNGKWKPKNFFNSNLSISEYATKDGHFTHLTIGYRGNTVFSMGKKTTPRKPHPSPPQVATEDQVLTIRGLIIQTQVPLDKVLQNFSAVSLQALSHKDAETAISKLTATLAKA